MITLKPLVALTAQAWITGSTSSATFTHLRFGEQRICVTGHQVQQTALHCSVHPLLVATFMSDWFQCTDPFKNGRLLNPLLARSTELHQATPMSRGSDALLQ